VSAPAATTAETRRDALTERLFEATVGALELLSVHIGWRLGLYQALVAGPATEAELAERAGIDARYTREWLEQQAVAGILEVDDADADPELRRFSLPAGHEEVLAVADSAAHVAPFGPMIVGIAGAMPAVIEAYRSGEGVPYERYGADFRDGQGAINRPAFVNETAAWIASMPEVDARLRDDGEPARVADVGCGQGHSTLAIASAYPRARVEGIDLDPASIEDAASLARAAGQSDAVEFRVADASELAASGPYDLVCIFEALHDMSRPVEVLEALRAALAPGGSVLLADERVAESFTAPGDEVERIMYGWSVTHCLPVSLAEQPSAALGTALRPGTVAEMAKAAGFASFEVLGIENDFFRFYRLAG